MSMERTYSRWQSAMSSTGECLAYIESSGTMSDITITFPGSDKSIRSHRWLLSMRSPVFEAMLNGPMAVDNKLELPQDNPDAFEWLLKHLYRDDHKLPEEMELAAEVFCLAHKYQIDVITDKYEKHLKEEVDNKNFPFAFSAAVLLENENLLRACEEVLVYSTDDVLKLPQIGFLSRSAFRFLLGHRNLAPSSETVVFEAIAHWGKAQLENESTLVNEDLKDKLKQSLKSVTKSNLSECAMRKILQALPQTDLTHSDVDTSEDVEAKPDKEVGGHEPIENTVTPTTVGEHHSQLRQVIEEFLPAVRYLDMSLEGIASILCYDILTQEEGLAILKKVRGVPGPSLPKFVSRCNNGARKPSGKHKVLLINNVCETNYNFTFRKEMTLNLMQNFQTSKSIFLVSLSSTCFVSLKEGDLMIIDSADRIVGCGLWRGVSYSFKKPLELASNETYKIELKISDVLYSSGSRCSFSIDKEDVKFTGNALPSGKIEISYIVNSEM